MKTKTTTATTTTKVNCPTCKTSVIWNEQSHYRPFCSERCQKIDFGEWASEGFSIPGRSVDPEIEVSLASNLESEQHH